MRTITALILASVGFNRFVYALPDYEPFADATASGGTSYTVGAALVGQKNAQGLSWFQAGASAPTTAIQSGNLSVPGLNPPSGNSVLMVPQGNVASRFALGASVNSGSIYYSFILRVPDIGTTMGSGGGFVAGFNNTGASSQTGSPTVIGARTLIRAASGGFNLGLSKSSSTASDFQWGSATFTTSDTIFIVGSYDFATLSGASDDSSRMWINPSSSDFGAATAPAPTIAASTGPDVTTSGSIQSFLLYARANTLMPNQMIIDEILIGTSWADVTPTGLGITSQPQSQRVLIGNSASFGVTAVGAAGYQWLFNGANLPGASGASLTLTNAQLTNSGSYQVVVTNGPVSLTSKVASLTVLADVFPRLRPLWSIPPNTPGYPYVTVDTSSTPNQRSITYNTLSNQLLVVSRTNFVTGATTPMIYVLDASTGANLYTLDTSVVTNNGGAPGSPPLTLVCIDVADDGAVYAANVSTTNSNTGTNAFTLYRWASSAPNQAGTLVYQGAPTSDNTPRWGDTLRARGAATGTEVIADSNDGAWFTVLTPTDSSMSSFISTLHTNFYGAGTIGRSLQFGATNSFYEKRKGAPLQLSTYDATAGSPVTVLTNFANFDSALGPVSFPLGTNFLCGLDFAASNSVPDTLDLFEVSDLSLPVLLAKYNLPTNHQANANFIGQVRFGGTNVFVVDGNNGIAAFTWASARPLLSITESGNNVILSWPASATGFTLYGAPVLSLSGPSAWTSLGTGTIVGGNYVVTNAVSGTSMFYRLQP